MPRPPDSKPLRRPACTQSSLTLHPYPAQAASNFPARRSARSSAAMTGNRAFSAAPTLCATAANCARSRRRDAATCTPRSCARTKVRAIAHVARCGAHGDLSEVHAPHQLHGRQLFMDARHSFSHACHFFQPCTPLLQSCTALFQPCAALFQPCTPLFQPCAALFQSCTPIFQPCTPLFQSCTPLWEGRRRKKTAPASLAPCQAPPLALALKSGATMVRPP